ncbi:hypothetical protein BcDW1_1674 [Botrytis cinerea BcDW1]|uniref:Uncharacterized protein n=1 Tax=Botryotinia fuckeliana (strain BcDW1) TaxID=1290391 RepID=M7V0I3_BOTF1|nr:hypothetical protein BcDW1_1674 [Botrytis cinerea BcDW1]
MSSASNTRKRKVPNAYATVLAESDPMMLTVSTDARDAVFVNLIDGLRSRIALLESTATGNLSQENVSASASATLRDEGPARISYDDALQPVDGQQPEERHELRNSNDTVADGNLPNSLTSYGSPIMVREHGQ